MAAAEGLVSWPSNLPPGPFLESARLPPWNLSSYGSYNDSQAVTCELHRPCGRQEAEVRFRELLLAMTPSQRWLQLSKGYVLLERKTTTFKLFFNAIFPASTKSNWDSIRFTNRFLPRIRTVIVVRREEPVRESNTIPVRLVDAGKIALKKSLNVVVFLSNRV